MAISNCPNCGEKLNIDEKSAGKCFSCNYKFNGEYQESTFKSINYTHKNDKNLVGRIIRYFSFLVLAVGIFNCFTLGDFFTWGLFISTFITGFTAFILLLALSEIIILLDDIKNK